MDSVEFSSWLRRGASHVNGNRVVAAALLLTAVILGAWLRFAHLGRDEMVDDEGASWAAAHLHRVDRVAAASAALDPGKLAIYDLLLHRWIKWFGDGLAAMRAMSALFGTLAIGAAFFAVRETCACLGDRAPPDIGETAGAVAALFVATNVALIDSARVARMYPLVLFAEIVQMTFLVRAQRRPTFANLTGVALATALAFAANFTASLLLMAEAVWLGALIVLGWIGRNRTGLAAFVPGLAVLAGLVLLAPLMPSAMVHAANGLRYSLGWLKLQPITWPWDNFLAACGYKPLLALLGFGVVGVALQWWRGMPLPALFLALVWFAGPILACFAVSYLIHPIEWPRYVIVSYAGLCAFAALGIASLRSTVATVLIAAVIALFWLRADRNYLASLPHQPAWSQSLALALSVTPRGQAIAVFPDYTTGVSTYYLRHGDMAIAVPADEAGCSSAPTLIMTGRYFMPASQVAAQDHCYPHLLRSLRYSEVRTK